MHHTRRWLAVLGFAFLASFVAGCGTQAGEQPEKKAEQAEKKVELKLASASEIFAEVKKHSGKAVVVDCWSTYCEPCKKEFPGLLKMQEKHGDKLVCLSVCLDFSGAGKPEDGQEEALKFLKELNSTITNYLSTTADEDFHQAVKKEFKLPEAPAGVPVILVFDKEGKLARRWDTTNLAKERDFSYAKSVDPVVEKLVQ